MFWPRTTPRSSIGDSDVTVPADNPLDKTADVVQSSGQWAVRWHGVVLFCLLCLSVPLWHLTWHGLLGHERPLVQTRESTSWPAFSLASAVRARPGQPPETPAAWMSQVERYLQSNSPIVWQLRGAYNEHRYQLGIYHSDAVYFGGDNWAYITDTLRPDVEILNQHAAQRIKFLHRVRDRAKELGLFLVVTLVPDKVRIYPQYAYPDGQMPADKAGVYDRLLAEFESAGIATVDLAQAISAAKQSGALPLYYSRDSHWRGTGALAAASATAALIERRVPAGELGARLPTELGPGRSVVGLAGLVGTAGFRTFEQDSGGKYPMTLSASRVAALLSETKRYYSVQVAGQPSTPMLTPERLGQARVLQAGTSFSGDNGTAALTLVLGRPVEAEVIPGAAGLAPLAECLRRAAAEPGRYRVLVWEIVERGMFSGAWQRLDSFRW